MRSTVWNAAVHPGSAQLGGCDGRRRTIRHRMPPGRRSQNTLEVLVMSRGHLAYVVEQREFRRIARVTVQQLVMFPSRRAAGAQGGRSEELSAAPVRLVISGVCRHSCLPEALTAIWKMTWQSIATEELDSVVAGPLALGPETVREHSDGPDSEESGPSALSDIGVPTGTNQWAWSPRSCSYDSPTRATKPSTAPKGKIHQPMAIP